MKDALSSLKTDSFENFIVYAIPGLILVCPYFFIIVDLYNLGRVVSENQVTTSMTLALAAITCGYLLVDFGAWCEPKWDEKLSQQPRFLLLSLEWYRYLRLAFSEEPIGQRYIKKLATRMKFERNIAPAFFMAGLGILIYLICYYFEAHNMLSATQGSVEQSIVLGLSLAVVLLFSAGWFIWREAKATHEALAEMRSNLLKGVYHLAGDHTVEASMPVIEPQDAAAGIQLFRERLGSILDSCGTVGIKERLRKRRKEHMIEEKVNEIMELTDFYGEWSRSHGFEFELNEEDLRQQLESFASLSPSTKESLAKIFEHAKTPMATSRDRNQASK